MKKIWYILFVGLVVLNSCEPIKDDDDGTDIKVDVAFYTNADGADIEVKIDGEVVGVVSDFVTGTPDCDNPKALIVELVPGTYTVTAGDGVYTWSDTYEVQIWDCNTFLLDRLKK